MELRLLQYLIEFVVILLSTFVPINNKTLKTLKALKGSDS
jgi:hypothetical protein